MLSQSTSSLAATKRRALVIQISFCIAILLIWEIATRSGLVSSYVLPPFTVTCKAMFDQLGNGKFYYQISQTAWRVAAAYILGVVPALAVGLAMGTSPRIRAALSPAINVIMMLPQSIFLPLFILFLGVDSLQKVVFGATHIVFVVATGTMAAVLSVPVDFITAARTMGATERDITQKVMIPMMLPILVNALRIGFILCVAAVLYAEIYAARDGIGYQIMLDSEGLKTSKAMGSVLFVSIAVIVINEAVRAVERRLGEWQLSAMEK